MPDRCDLLIIAKITALIIVVVVIIVMRTAAFVRDFLAGSAWSEMLRRRRTLLAYTCVDNV